MAPWFTQTSPLGYPLTWAVPAGRRDGTISKASDAVENLPHGTDDVDQLTQRFAEKGLSQEEMVILSGKPPNKFLFLAVKSACFQFFHLECFY